MLPVTRWGISSAFDLSNETPQKEARSCWTYGIGTSAASAGGPSQGLGCGARAMSCFALVLPQRPYRLPWQQPVAATSEKAQI